MINLKVNLLISMDDPKRIPPKETVEQLIKDVVRERLKVDSQERLCYLVLKRLKQLNQSYVITPRRVKNLALGIKEIEVKVKTKKSFSIKKIEKCPVCGGRLLPAYGKNLMNKRILIGYRCEQCEYVSDIESFLPMKYVFVWKGAR